METPTTNANVSVNISAWRHSMPSLQSLELKGFNVTSSVTEFPWTTSSMFLPVNLSRTDVGQSHYSYNIAIQANQYRRVIEINKAMLNTMDLQGFLQKINLQHNNLVQIELSTFSHVQGLQALDLSHNQLNQIASRFLQGQDELLYIDLSYNNLATLSTEWFTNLPKIKEIKLAHNLLIMIESRTFSNLKQLSLIDLSSNLLIEINNDAIASDVENMEKFQASQNMLRNIPHFIFYQRSLKEANFDNNQITFDELTANIQTADASRFVFMNRDTASSYPTTFVPNSLKQISLVGNKIDTLNIHQDNFTKEQTQLFYLMLSVYNIDLRDNRLVCDCHMYKFYKYLHGSMKITMNEGGNHYELTPNTYYQQTLLCKEPNSVQNTSFFLVPPEQFMCKVNLSDCPQLCECYTRSLDAASVVLCSNPLMTSLPSYVPSGTVELNITNTRVSTIKSIPQYINFLKRLDLSRNNISQVSKTFWDVLSAYHTNTTVRLDYNKLTTLNELPTNIAYDLYLAHNPWHCDCHAVMMKTWLFHNRNHIKDMELVICVTGYPSGQKVVDVQDGQFICPVDPVYILRVSLLSTGAVILVLGIILWIVYRYRGEIKILLYVHFHIHPFDKSDDADILNMDYDVFISYCGTDYRWVVFELLKNLESHDPPYKTCLHDRDFEVGAAIQENIMTSISRSRRMIMVLSKAYLQSKWCMLEFRAAHQRVLNEKTNYLVLILYDDINFDELDDDMKLYITTNTYLSKDNKWFWDKLFYALPVNPLQQLDKEQITNESLRRKCTTSDSALGMELDSLAKTLPSTTDKMNW